jgi:hypothetical protein
MSNQFNPINESLDIAWLQANGWTLAGNLAYRHILHEFNKNGVPCQERIMQIIMQYNAEAQAAKIIETLRDLVALKKELNGKSM